MASKRRTLPLFFMVLLLVALATLASASDMSIIDFDKQHGMHFAVPNNRTDVELWAMYQSWLAQHGKAYNGLGEKEQRFEVFKDNLRFVDEHNAHPGQTYWLGMNQFADLTNEQYRSMYLGFGGRAERKEKALKAKGSRRYAFEEGEELPDQVDWREKGAVAEVKDQGQCGNLISLWVPMNEIRPYSALFFSHFDPPLSHMRTREKS